MSQMTGIRCAVGTLNVREKELMLPNMKFKEQAK
jgi:hypothetical protein